MLPTLALHLLGQAPETGWQWQPLELTWEAPEEPADPFTPPLATEFVGPEERRLRGDWFWDGGRTWRCRWLPTAPGRWEARTARADGQAIDALNRVYNIRPAFSDNPLHRHGGILQVADSRRYLTYADGSPFFWLGDTWWFCPSPQMPFDASNREGIAAMFQHLVDLRARQGYTVLHWASLGAGVDGAAYAGRVDVEGWRTYDRYVQYATDRGLLPVIGFGFHQGLNNPTFEQLQRLWRYFLARYAAWPVGILICGEYNQHQGGREPSAQDNERVPKILRLGAWLKERDPYQRALTVHPWWFGSERRQAWGEGWYDYIMVQGGHGAAGPPPEFYRRVYAEQAKPLLEGEVTYEGIHRMGAEIVRKNAAKAIQCGSFGFTYGAHGLWYPTQDERDEKFKEWGPPIPWWQAAELPGAAQVGHLKRFYETIDWWRLEPVATATCLDPADDRLLVKASDRTVVVYLPAGRPAGPVRWREGQPRTVQVGDPRTGELRSAPPAATLPELPLEQDWLILAHRP